MKLADVASGAIYIDTNVLYMYLRSDLQTIVTIKAFLKRVISNKIMAFVSIPTVDELYYRLLLAQIKSATGRNPLDVLRENQADTIHTYHASIDYAIQKLLTLPNVMLVAVEEADCRGMLNNIGTFGLLPRDALHLAIMQRLDLLDIASDDMDFDRVAGLTRHWVIHPPSLAT